MPMKDDDDEDVWNPAATLDRSGKIDGLIVPKDQRREPTSWQEERPIELDRRPPPEPEPEPKPPRLRTNASVAIALVVAVLFAAAGAIAFVTRSRSLAAGGESADEQVAPASDSHEEGGARSLAIESEPSGANVIVDGETVGRTPFLGSNGVAGGKEAEVRVELPGFKPWVGTLKGGVNARLRAKLKRR
jgi:PEGA domain